MYPCSILKFGVLPNACNPFPVFRLLVLPDSSDLPDDPGTAQKIAEQALGEIAASAFDAAPQ
jgi:hypothetical protein